MILAKNIHKGTEFNNINETWAQNERNRNSSNTPERLENTDTDNAPQKNSLEQLIHEEASEYDRANKEERLLSGDRASVKDDEGTAADE